MFVKVQKFGGRQGVKALLPLLMYSERRESWFLQTSTSDGFDSFKTTFDRSCLFYASESKGGLCRVTVFHST
jgi:hypothetical protein